MDTGRITYDSRTLTLNLCSNQFQMSKCNFLIQNDQENPQGLVDACQLLQFCPHTQIRTKQRKQTVFPKLIT